MRIIILTISAITITTLAYYFVQEDTLFEWPKAKPQSAPTYRIEDKLKLGDVKAYPQVAMQDNKTIDENQTAQDLDSIQYQENIQMQMQFFIRQFTEQLAHLNKKLTNIESKVQSLELASVGQIIDTTEWSDEAEKLYNDHENSQIEQLELEDFSDTALGNWMDVSLQESYWENRESTKLAIEQAEMSLEKVPGIFLENMQCGEKFCRATLAHENGEKSSIRNLFGEPPFTNEGFTIEQQDGSVALYFVQSGLSLSDMRSKALESSLVDSEK